MRSNRPRVTRKTSKEALLYRHPWLQDQPELLDKIIKARTPILKHDKQQRALRMWAAGMSRDDICRVLKCSASSLHYSQKVYPDEFGKPWALITKNRPKQVEAYLLKYMLGMVQEVKVYSEAARDENGKPLMSRGKPVWIAVKKEVKQLPPHADLIKFYLQTHMEEYRTSKQGDQGDTLLPTAALQAKVDELKQAAKQMTITVNEEKRKIG